jgi:hypothetical protein
MLAASRPASMLNLTRDPVGIPADPINPNRALTLQSAVADYRKYVNSDHCRRLGERANEPDKPPASRRYLLAPVAANENDPCVMAITASRQVSW